jgi:hypothetical protein
MHHPRSIDTALDTLDPYSWQPKQQCRTVRHSPWFLPSPECFATLRLQKAKGLLLQRHAHESEITTARLNFKSRYGGPIGTRWCIAPSLCRSTYPSNMRIRSAAHSIGADAASFTRLLHLHIADRPAGNASKNRSRALVCTGSIPHTVLAFDLAARIPARASRRIAAYHRPVTRPACSSLDATAHPCLKSQSELSR